MLLEQVPRAQVQSRLQSRPRDQLGCRDAHVLVKWGEDDGANLLRLLVLRVRLRLRRWRRAAERWLFDNGPDGGEY
jgi:hypothetical protein